MAMQRVAGDLENAAYPFQAPINAALRVFDDSYLYFLRTPARPTWLKIGIAADVDKRLRSFRLGNPDIELVTKHRMPRLFDRQVERRVHEALAEHARGREWFEVDIDTALKVARPLLVSARAAAIRVRAYEW